MSIGIPERYKRARAAVPFDAVSIGYRSIELAPVEQVEDLQQGYGIVPAGQTTDWQDQWLVIGIDGLCGDPIFIDTSNESFPVFTAIHGEGEWSPELIASSFQHFVEILQRLQELARGRATPAEIKQHPLSSQERQAFIDFIRRRSPDTDLSFWELICETDTRAA